MIFVGFRDFTLVPFQACRSLVFCPGVGAMTQFGKACPTPVWVAFAPHARGGYFCGLQGHQERVFQFVSLAAVPTLRSSHQVRLQVRTRLCPAE